MLETKENRPSPRGPVHCTPNSALSASDRLARDRRNRRHHIIHECTGWCFLMADGAAIARTASVDELRDMWRRSEGDADARRFVAALAEGKSRSPS